jgi:hypothetical protein
MTSRKAAHSAATAGKLAALTEASGHPGARISTTFMTGRYMFDEVSRPASEVGSAGGQHCVAGIQRRSVWGHPGA